MNREKLKGPSFEVEPCRNCPKRLQVDSEIREFALTTVNEAVESVVEGNLEKAEIYLSVSEKFLKLADFLDSSLIASCSGVSKNNTCTADSEVIETVDVICEDIQSSDTYREFNNKGE